MEVLCNSGVTSDNMVKVEEAGEGLVCLGPCKWMGWGNNRVVIEEIMEGGVVVRICFGPKVGKFEQGCDTIG